MKHFSSNRKGQVFGLDGLQGFVLLIVLVGMLIGIGIITLDKTATASYNTVVGHNDSITISDIENNTAISMDYGNITGVTRVQNGTSATAFNIVPSKCYIINETWGLFYYTNVTTPTDTCGNVDTIYALYDYKEYATATRDALTSASAEVSGLATNWLGLIVTIAILAIILSLVLLAFRPGMDRG